MFDLTGISFIKSARVQSPLTGAWVPGDDDDKETQNIVRRMIQEIREGGEKVCLDYAEKLDKYTGNIVLSEEEIEEQIQLIPLKDRKSIDFSISQVQKFAAETRSKNKDWEVDLGNGSKAGTKVVPVETAGCYVPGGLYGYTVAAIMTAGVAKAAGVTNIICTAPTNKSTGKIHPYTLYAMKKAGATKILALGGVQGIAALAFGLFTGNEADIIVGPGNKFVAEAKRQLFGRVGIDQIAGPTEIGIIADDTADPHVIATDLVSQAEHGPTSPAWLITTSRRVGEEVSRLVPELVAKLDADMSSVGGTPATRSWPDYGEIVLVETREEAVRVSDRYASEHLELQTCEEDLDWYHQRLRNYGSLFIGEGSTVTHGDKATGTNHVLPTRRVARYTGGLSVEKFLKKLTWQKLSKESQKTIGVASAQVSRMEGMEGHARAADVRLEKYFPGEKFDLHPENIK